MTTGVPRVVLAAGYDASQLIKGGWQLAGGHGSVDRAAALADMARFVDAGITTFDCADIYTGVEALIGEFLRARGGAAPDVQVHTKFVPDLDALSSLNFRDVERIIDRSRQRLGVDTLDLVQFHWWDYRIPGMLQALDTLMALRERGAIAHLGVTNFDTASLELMTDAGVPLISHQVQYSLLDRRPADTLAPLCARRGVTLLAYGTVAGGLLAERWLGAAEPSAPYATRSLHKYKLIVDEFGGWALFQDLLRMLATIAARHGSSIGSVAIRWVLDQPGVGAAIIGARSPAHLESQLAALSLPLTPEDRREIDAVLSRATGPRGDVYDLERDREGPHGRIMRYNLNARLDRPDPRAQS